MLAFGLFCVAIDDSGDFFVEDAVVDVGLLGVEVFVEGGSDHAVGVDPDPELLGDLADVGRISGSRGRVLAISAFVREDEEVASIFDILFEVFDFSGGEVVLGSGHNEEIGFFDLFEVNSFFVESDLR